jgi:hypothetical protein
MCVSGLYVCKCMYVCMLSAAASSTAVSCTLSGLYVCKCMYVCVYRVCMYVNVCMYVWYPPQRPLQQSPAHCRVFMYVCM